MALAGPKRDVTPIGRAAPLLTGVLCVLLSVMPKGVPELANVWPAFVLMAVFHWTVYRPDLLPAVAVFVLGMLLDLLNDTPIGLSALTLLTARTLLIRQRSFFLNQPFTVMWGGFLIFAVGSFAFEAAVMVFWHRATFGIRPVIFESVLTVACFPLGSWLLAGVHRGLVVRP
jgi:rod shape-determining protein MreD